MPTTQTTLNAAKGWAPDIVAFVPTDAVPDALIMQCTTVATTELDGDAPVAMVPYVDDDTAEFVGEGETIDTAEPELAMAMVRTGKVSLLIRVSNEQFGQTNTANLLSESARRSVTVRANAAFIAQTPPVGPAVTPPAGIIHHDDLIDAGEIGDNLDELVDLGATLEGAGAMLSHFVLAPDAWATLRKMKTSDDSNVNLLGAGTTDAQRLLLGVPVLVSPSVPSGTGLLLDKGAIVSAVSPVRVAQSEHAFFSADSTALRVTWRIGAEVMRPERVGTFTVGTLGS